jgi:hypothetical protein
LGRKAVAPAGQYRAVLEDVVDHEHLFARAE